MRAARVRTSTPLRILHYLASGGRSPPGRFGMAFLLGMAFNGEADDYVTEDYDYYNGFNYRNPFFTYVSMPYNMSLASKSHREAYKIASDKDEDWEDTIHVRPSYWITSESKFSSYWITSHWITSESKFCPLGAYNLIRILPSAICDHIDQNLIDSAQKRRNVIEFKEKLTPLIIAHSRDRQLEAMEAVNMDEEGVFGHGMTARQYDLGNKTVISCGFNLKKYYVEEPFPMFPFNTRISACHQEYFHMFVACLNNDWSEPFMHTSTLPQLQDLINDGQRKYILAETTRWLEGVSSNGCVVDCNNLRSNSMVSARNTLWKDQVACMEKCFARFKASLEVQEPISYDMRSRYELSIGFLESRTSPRKLEKEDFKKTLYQPFTQQPYTERALIPLRELTVPPPQQVATAFRYTESRRSIVLF